MNIEETLQQIRTSENPWILFLDVRTQWFGESFSAALSKVAPRDDEAWEAWIAQVDTDQLRLRVRSIASIHELRGYLLDEATFHQAWMVHDSLGSLAFQCEDRNKGMWYWEWLAKIRLCRSLGELLEMAIAYNLSVSNLPPDVE